MATVFHGRGEKIRQGTNNYVHVSTSNDLLSAKANKNLFNVDEVKDVLNKIMHDVTACVDNSRALRGNIVTDNTTAQGKTGARSQKAQEKIKLVNICEKINVNNDITCKVLYQNVNGWSQKKYLVVANVLMDKHIDIFAITEHKKGRKQDLPEFKEYDRWATCREVENGGGVCVWVRKGKFVRVCKIPLPEVRPEIEEDQLWLALDTGKERIAMGIVYVRPVGKHCKKKELLERMQIMNIRTLELQKQGYTVILVGDFNAKMITTGEQIKGDNEAGCCLIDLIAMTDLLLVNHDPVTVRKYTWIPEGGRADQNSSTLDYIVADKQIITTECVIDEDRDLKMESDHVPIIWTFQIKGEEEHEHEENIGWNDLKDADWDSYSAWAEYKLRRVYDISVKEHNDMSYDDIQQAIKEAGLDIIGKREVTQGRPKEEPMQLRKARQLLAQARRRVLHQMKQEEGEKRNRRLDICRAKVWAARQGVRELERQEETKRTQKFMDGILKQNDKNMRKLYSYMNRNKKSVQEKFGLKNEQGILVTTDIEIKEQLRVQWNKIYHSGYWPQIKHTQSYTDLRLQKGDIDGMDSDIREWELDIAVAQLHNGTSSGTTDIPPELIKHLSSTSKGILLVWMRHLWDTAELPGEIDRSRSIFLHKKGNTHSLDNYRTITTGCNLCKVYNRVLTNRLQEAMETSEIFGEIQNGFRKGRRATDSLLVLEALIRKSKREKKKTFLALLDITKAYDRVNRNILWKVMEQMGVPEKLMSNIRASYRNPSTVLQFQDITSEPFQMTIGLKQGCVMSPILFAIYIAELGHKLQKSDLGVSLDNIKIPGMFFADDMMLVGTKTELQKLLNMVGEFALKFQIEFAGHKSCVIPLGEAVNKERRWKLGAKYIGENEKEEIWVKEEDSGRYLGVTIQKNYNIFKPQWELAAQKARRGATVVSILARRCHNPLTILKPMWQQYIQPSFLYGTEIMEYNKTGIKKLETIQRNLMKTVLRVLPGTATAGVYAMTGLTQVVYEIWKRKLLYYIHIRAMSDNRWAKKAYNEQFQWGQRDSFWNHENTRDYDVEVKGNYWLAGMQTMAEKMGMVLPSNWKSQYVKPYIQWKRDNDIRETVPQQSTLLWIGPLQQDHMYNSSTQLWWMKMRIGSVRLNIRSAPDRKCLICNICDDTPEHMMQCDGYPAETLQAMLGYTLPEENGLNWLLHPDRSDTVRSQTSRWIKARWAHREKCFQERQAARVDR